MWGIESEKIRILRGTEFLMMQGALIAVRVLYEARSNSMKFGQSIR